MAISQSYTPIIEKEGTSSDYADQSPRGGGGGCFRRLCCGWDEGGYILQEQRGLHEEKESWLLTQLNKLKQLSEVVAGPKWKNMVRKIGKLSKCRRNTAAQFQYSPESYALNFADCEEDANLSHTFSTRFALISDQQRKGGL